MMICSVYLIAIQEQAEIEIDQQTVNNCQISQIQNQAHNYQNTLYH